MTGDIDSKNIKKDLDGASNSLRNKTFRWVFVAIFFVVVFAPHHVQAAVRTWDGGGTDGTCGGGAGDGNKWSCAANWSSNTIPGAADTALFDGTSTKDAVWDSSGPGTIGIFSLTSAYTGKLTIQKSSVLIVTSWSYEGVGTAAYFDAGTGTINMSGAVSFTPGSASYYNLSYSTGGSSVLTTTGTATILNNLSLTGVGATGGLEGGTFNVSGNISGNNFTDGTVGLSTINVVGTGTQTMTSTTSFYLDTVNINKSAGTLNLVGFFTVSVAWTYTKGNINAGTSSISFVGNAAFSGGSSQLYNSILFSSSGSSTQTVSGTVNTTNLFFSGTTGTQVNGGTINVKGTLTTSAGGSGASGSTNITLNGTSDQTITSSSGWLPAGTLTINKTAGTTSLSGTLNLISNFVRTAGTINAGTSTIVFRATASFTPGANVTYYNISLTGGTITLGSNLTLSNTLTINGGTLTTSGSNYSISTVNFSHSSGTFTANASIVRVSGSFTHSAGTFSQGTSTVILNGTNQTVTGTTTFYNLYKLLPTSTTDTLTFTHTTTYTIASGGTARFIGTRGYPLSIESSLAGSAFTLTKTGSIVAEYVNLKDCTVSVATSAPASTDVSGNTNWTFTTEFVSTIRASDGDYTTLSGWESAVQADLTAATTKVFGHGGITGTIADNTAVSGATSLATGTAVHVTSTQILIKSISGTFQSGEQIRVDGSNYVTSSDAGNGAIAVAEAYNDWPNALNDSVALSGWTTDADNFILITVPDAESHNGKLKDAASDYYRGFTLNPSASTAIIFDNQQNYSRVDGLAVDGTNATATNIRLNGTSPLGFRLLSANGVDGLSLSGGAIVMNSLAYDGTGKCYEDTTGATTHYTVYNSTARGCVHGFHGNNTTTAITIKNSLASGNSTADYALTNTGTKTVIYSASSDATADDFGTTTGDRVSQTFSFVDAANKDFHLAPKDAGARNYGTDLLSDGVYPIVVDIDSDTRPTVNPSDTNEASYDIGADEADYAMVQVKDGIRLKDGVRLK